MTTLETKLAEALREVLCSAECGTVPSIGSIHCAREALAEYEREKAGQSHAPICDISCGIGQGQRCTCRSKP